MPRTRYYDRLLSALKGLPNFEPRLDKCDFLFPEEDTTVETNWPRYGNRTNPFIHGDFDRVRHELYLDRLLQTKSPLCVVNMHPFIRVPVRMLPNPNIVVADVNLRTWERALAPRTISMPAMPVTVGQYRPELKRILAGFRGVESHPCRGELSKIHDGKSIQIEMVQRSNHSGKIDADSGQVDRAYVDMMEQSIFAIVPRGDAEFSYRLLEAMSFGCIPIILADGLVLPFDRLIDWPKISLHMPESRVEEIPKFLTRISRERIAKMQAGVQSTFRKHFSDLERVAISLVKEFEFTASTD